MYLEEWKRNTRTLGKNAETKSPILEAALNQSQSNMLKPFELVLIEYVRSFESVTIKYVNSFES